MNQVNVNKFLPVHSKPESELLYPEGQTHVYGSSLLVLRVITVSVQLDGDLHEFVSLLLHSFTF